MRREFNLGGNSLCASPERLNGVGWDVESLSSRQRVYGVLAELTTDLCIPEQSIGASYPATAQGARELLRNLACLNVGRSTTSGSKGLLVEPGVVRAPHSACPGCGAYPPGYHSWTSQDHSGKRGHEHDNGEPDLRHH